MDELNAVLVASRDKEHRQNKFLAALQDKELEGGDTDTVTFEDIKARVFSGGKASNSKDIMSMQGINAQQAGWGIGNGVEYQEAGADFSWT